MVEAFDEMLSRDYPGFAEFLYEQIWEEHRNTLKLLWFLLAVKRERNGNPLLTHPPIERIRARMETIEAHRSRR